MLADRIEEINPFQVMEVLARAGEFEQCDHEVVHFEVGEPDFKPAQPIIEAGIEALGEGQTKYTETTGIEVLRDRIADSGYPCNEVFVRLTGAKQVTLAVGPDSQFQSFPMALFIFMWMFPRTGLAGGSFGQHRASTYVRVAFTTSDDAIEEGPTRISKALTRWACV